MTQQTINNGTAAGDGTGESLFNAFTKVNANFTELYGFSATALYLGSIGVTVQGYSANLTSFAGITPTAAGLALLDDANAAAQRATLGLGTAATSNTGDFATSGHNHSGVYQPADAGSVPQFWATETGAPSAAIVYSETQVGLRMVPDEAGSLAVRLALRPALTATAYPDEFHNLYQEKIAAGALAKLYAQPNKPWSNPGLVADCRDRFDSCILDAEFRADRGSANAPARTTLNLIGGR